MHNPTVGIQTHFQVAIELVIHIRAHAETLEFIHLNNPFLLHEISRDEVASRLIATIHIHGMAVVLRETA